MPKKPRKHDKSTASETKQGLVAFFDILGYQNIIDKNTIGPVSKIIGEILLVLPNAVRKKVKARFGRRFSNLISELFKDLEVRLISDSILLSYPFEKDASPLNTLIQILMFIKYTEELLKFTFINGLPMRGAIDVGEFFLIRECFAGKPIIECYRLGQSGG